MGSQSYFASQLMSLCLRATQSSSLTVFLLLFNLPFSRSSQVQGACQQCLKNLLCLVVVDHSQMTLNCTMGRKRKTSPDYVFISLVRTTAALYNNDSVGRRRENNLPQYIIHCISCLSSDKKRIKHKFTELYLLTVES